MWREKITTVILIIMTIFLIGAIFYFSYLLMQKPSDQSNSSAVAPKNTKAQVVNSEKFIALNTTSNNSSPTLQPSLTLSPTLYLLDSPTPTIIEVITPTEVILVKGDSLTPLPTNNNYLSPTTIKKLPETGYISYNLIIFLFAIFLIFYSFVS